MIYLGTFTIYVNSAEVYRKSNFLMTGLIFGLQLFMTASKGHQSLKLKMKDKIDGFLRKKRLNV
jgi:hypothetical protein